MKRIHFGLAAFAVLALGSCSKTSGRETRLTDLTHGIVKSVPVLVDGTHFESSVWVPAAQDHVLNRAVEIARTSEAFSRIEARIGERYVTQEVPALFDGIGAQVSSIVESGESSSSGGGLSTLPGLASGGALPSSPAVGGGGSLPTTSDLSGTDSLPTSPATANSGFSPTPALLAEYLASGGSSSSASNLAGAYCDMFAGLISYFDRCVDGFADVKTAVEAAFGSAACRASLGPAFEAALPGVSSAVVNTISCMGEAFEEAACDTNEDGLSTKLSEAMEAKCGVQFQE